MSKTLIISDIHHRWQKAEKLILKEKPDKTIFLGDYFDNFDDSAFEARETAQWLKGSLKFKNRIHIRGNHDTHYESQNTRLKCSGYELKKDIVINEIMKATDWRKLYWFHYENGWLFTHAGVHPLYVGPQVNRIEIYMAEEAKKANYVYFESKGSHWFWHIGASRYGWDGIGGITWCDANREFEAVPGQKQIFGHTPQQVTNVDELWLDENNLCLDTHSNHYALMDERGNVTVKKV